IFYAMQFIQGQGLDRVIEELARLRASTAGSTHGAVSKDARRSRSEAEIEDDLTFGTNIPAGPTEDEASAPHDAQMTLSKMAISLLKGRFLDDLEKPGVGKVGEAEVGELTVTSAKAQAAFARTEAIDQTPPSELSPAADPHKISAAQSSSPSVLPR